LLIFFSLKAFGIALSQVSALLWLLEELNEELETIQLYSKEIEADEDFDFKMKELVRINFHTTLNVLVAFDINPTKYRFSQIYEKSQIFTSPESCHHV